MFVSLPSLWQDTQDYSFKKTHLDSEMNRSMIAWLSCFGAYDEGDHPDGGRMLGQGC